MLRILLSSALITHTQVEGYPFTAINSKEWGSDVSSGSMSDTGLTSGWVNWKNDMWKGSTFNWIHKGPDFEKYWTKTLHFFGMTSGKGKSYGLGQVDPVPSKAPDKIEREETCPAAPSKAVADYGKLNNGNFAMPENGKRGLDFFLQFADSDADFKNTFGVYFEDDNCNPLGGVILVSNFKETTKGGPTKRTVSHEKIPAGATQFGYFIIPDGYGSNTPSITTEETVIIFKSRGKRRGYKAYNKRKEIRSRVPHNLGVVFTEIRSRVPHNLGVVFTKAHLNPRFVRMVVADGWKADNVEGDYAGSYQILQFEDGGSTGFQSDKESTIDYNDVIVTIGVRAEVPKSCENSPKDYCGDHGYCAVEEKKTTCKCTDGYTGEVCEITPTTQAPAPEPASTPAPAKPTTKPADQVIITTGTTQKPATTEKPDFECTCDNGTPLTSEDSVGSGVDSAGKKTSWRESKPVRCNTEKPKKCSSCEENFVLDKESQLCVPVPDFECTCDNGKPLTSEESVGSGVDSAGKKTSWRESKPVRCSTAQQQKCSSCNDNFVLDKESQLCVPGEKKKKGCVDTRTKTHDDIQAKQQKQHSEM